MVIRAIISTAIIAFIGISIGIVESDSLANSYNTVTHHKAQLETYR